MTWLTPMTGIVLAGVLVPLLLALYFLKLRRKAAAIPSTLLWKRSVEDLRANAPFQRLRPNLLLILQLLLLGFVAFALAQPRMDIGGSSGGRIVLLIDRSGSMGATDLGKERTRLDIAKEQAKERAEKQFSGGLFSGTPGEVMVVAFDDAAKVVQPFTRSKADVLRAIERIQPSDGGTRLSEAMTLARAYTTVTNPDAKDAQAAVASPATYELYSDGRIGDLAEMALRPGEEMIYHVVGRADAANVGIDGIAAERSARDPGQMQVYVSLRNDSTEDVQVELQLAIDRAVRWVSPKSILVKAGAKDPQTGLWKPGTQRATLPPVIQPRAGVVTVEVTRKDALMADNLADIVVAAPKRMRIGMVGQLDFAVRDVVQAIPCESVEALTAEEFAQRTKASGATDFDVVVATAAALPNPVPRGRYLVLGLPEGIDGLNPFGEKQNLVVTSTRAEHPVLRAVNLNELYVAKAAAIAPNTDVEALVESAGTPLVVLVRRGATQAIIVGFEPLDSNWPFLRSFVTFTANAAEWLGSIDQAAAQEEHHPGDALVARLPAGARDVRMQPPFGEAQSVEARDGVVTYGPVERAGVYTLTWSEGGAAGQRVFAVNPTPGEGYIAAAEAVSFGSRTLVAQGGGGSLLSDLWPYALAAAIVLLVVEWWVYHRKHWLRRAPPPAKAAPIIRA